MLENLPKINQMLSAQIPAILGLDLFFIEAWILTKPQIGLKVHHGRAAFFVVDLVAWIMPFMIKNNIARFFKWDDDCRHRVSCFVYKTFEIQIILWLR